MDWSKEDLIRWVETRVVRASVGSTEPGRPSRKDLETWLAKVRDNLSWEKIALVFYGGKHSAAVSKARRAYGRVRRSHPGIVQKARKRPGPKPKTQPDEI